MDFEWYRSFISIYKHGSVSEAAKTRMMTQPAMSQHLAALEAEVGEPLFTRTSRKMVPTERGKDLYTRLVPLIEALEETTLSFKMVSTPALPVVRIASAQEFFRERISPRLASFSMRVIARFGTAPVILDFLLEEKVDLIVTSQNLAAPGVEYLSYMREEFVIVAPSDFPEPAFSDVQEWESWLCSQPWLSYGLELPIIRRFWREHFQKRPQMQPAHVLPDLHTLLRAIEHGAGISLLPTYMLGSSLQTGKTKMLYPSCTVPNELYIGFLIKNRNLPQVKTAIESLKSILTS
ncbi:LysR family transcriptional regulator [Paenibacillus sp. P26]|nr:LysR family transcriptional regulator [Paenibacillus sp. P26]